jgi:tetratricopeptide (TPR) repeat protein
LKIVLTQNEIENIEKKPTENLEAFNYYLQGNIYYWRSYQEQDWSIAINMFQKAIELDPNFALAYTMLAKCHLQLYWFHFDRSNERLKDSKKAIDAAYSIDPDLPEVNIALAHYYYRGFLNYSEALKQLEIAREYLPNNAECNYLMACVYRRMGEWEKAEEKFVEAAENDPGNSEILTNTAETYYLLGDYERSLYYINKARNLNPEFSSPYYIKILLLLKCQGNINDAVQTLEEASYFINTSSDTRLINATVLLYIIEGKYQSAIDFLNKTNFEAVGEQFYYYPKPLLYAMIYDLMNEKNKANQYYTQSQIALETRLQDYPDDSRLYGALGICYAGLDKKEEAKEAGEYSVKLLPVSKEAHRGVYRLIDLAKIYVMVKEYDLALEKLDYVLSLPGELSVKFLQLDPRWQPLWELPEFQELRAKYSVNQ